MALGIKLLNGQHKRNAQKKKQQRKRPLKQQHTTLKKTNGYTANVTIQKKSLAIWNHGGIFIVKISILRFTEEGMD